jgi:hypothetical protein
MKRLLTLLTGISVVALAAVGVTRPADAQAPAYTYFPSASVTDARFLAIASSGLGTLSGNKVTIGFAAAETASRIEIGIYDGNTAGNWDMGATPMNYTLYADPQGNGADLSDAPDPIIGQWSGSVMPDSAWFDIPVTTGPAAQAPTGDYFYYLTVSMPAGTPGSVNNAFKVRTTGTMLLEAQSVSLISHYRTAADRLTVYPDWNTSTYLGRTNYDGKWDLYFDVATDTQFFSVWDGDSDFGSYDRTCADTDDPDTAAVGDSDAKTPLCETGVPVWALGTPAVRETVAGAAPLDDNGIAPQLRRSPAIQYGITTPDGDTFWNHNPSGNMEWEQFLISRAPFDRQVMDHHADVLSAGVYKMNIVGFDMGNLNAFRFLHDGMGVNANGDPVKPLRPYWTLGDRVWLDVNRNGQDDREAGIANVLLKLLDANGNPVLDGNGAPRTTRTDVGGFYRFNVTKTGLYTVTVDPSTLPSGLGSTTGGHRSTHEVVRSYPQQSFLQFDFGYGEGAAPAPTGQIGDRVWLDADRDGEQDDDDDDDGEKGIANVLVTLLDASGKPVAATSTDEKGYYRFSELAEGVYTVEIDPDTLPAGVAQTYDVDGGTAYAATVKLADGQTRRDVDFGYAAARTRKFTTFTQGGWGAKPSGSNPGTVLHGGFDKVFGERLRIGHQYELTFTSAAAVTEFLPVGGTPAVLKSDQTNPTDSEAGVLAGQVLALQLNLSFSAAGVTTEGLGELKLQSGAFAGYSVKEFTELAHRVLGGETEDLPKGATISSVNEAATQINENFDNGTVDHGFLK